MSPHDNYVATVNNNTANLWNFNIDYMLHKACQKIGIYLESNSTIEEYERNLCDVVDPVDF